MTRSILMNALRLVTGGAAGLLLLLLFYFTFSCVLSIRHTRKSASFQTSTPAAR
ncbi:MAG: hypothetical protein AAB074_10285 [Planctomycetota bacterium]